jgi:SEC-C motif-containing protein
MRSRYTAYVQGNEGYLVTTWHPTRRPAEMSLAQSQPDKWLGLKVIRTEQGELPATQGVVEFVARYKVNGRAGRIHEVSRFVFENGQWFYLEGEVRE